MKLFALALALTAAPCLAGTLDCRLDAQFIEGDFPQQVTVAAAGRSGLVKQDGHTFGYALFPNGGGGMMTADNDGYMDAAQYRCSLR